MAVMTHYPVASPSKARHLVSTVLVLMAVLVPLMAAVRGPGHCAPGDEFPTGAVFMPSDKWQLSQLDHYRLMKQFGFNQVEPEFMYLENGLSRWQFFEPHEGVINWFSLDHFVDDARKAGVKVYLDISVFGFLPIPKWVWQKHPGMAVKTPNGPVDELVTAPGTPSLAHPGYRQQARQFLTAVAARYKDDPNVAGIIIGNERGCSNSYSHDNETYYGLDYNDSVRDGFHAFLQQRYGTIANLNAKWGKSYASFSDIGWRGEWVTNTAAYRGEWLDFNLYRHKYVADFHRELHDGIKSVAPNMPTIAVSLGHYHSTRLAHGGDPASLEFVDYIGDKHYAWDTDNISEEKMVEYLSGITGKPYLIINQGTRSQMYDLPFTQAETHQMIRQAWQGIGRGAKGLLHWLWTEPTSWQLEKHSFLTNDAASMPVPKGILYDVAQSVRFMRRFDKILLGASLNADRQIAMLDADLTYIQDEPLYMRQDITRASFPSPGPQCEEWMAIASALVYNNYRVAHLSEQMVRDGKLDESRILVLAGTKYLYADVATKIEQWLSVPGRYLVLTASSGLYDELGRHSGWQSRIMSLYGSRIKLLTDNYVNPELGDLIAKPETQSMFSFLNLRIIRKYDLENISDRGRVSAGMLRYRDPASGKRTDLLVLTNRLPIGTDVTDFRVRVTEDFQYAAAYSFDPWHNPNAKPLVMSRSGQYVRVDVNALKDVLVLMFTEDPAEAAGDSEGPSKPYLDLTKKASWWDGRWTFRVPIQFYSAEHNGQDVVLKCSLDSQSMPALGQIDPATVRVFEMDRDWNLLGERQCSVQTPQAGKTDLFVRMAGTTVPYACRNFYAYFGPTGLPAGPALAVPFDPALKIQAEQTTSRDSAFRLKRQLDGFGGKALTLDRDVISGNGFAASYQFQITQSGSYRAFIRCIGGFYLQTDPLVLTDFQVTVDGVVRRSGAMGYDRIWQFESVDIGQLSAGTHTLDLFIKKDAPDFTLDYIAIAPASHTPASPVIAEATWIGNPDGATILGDSFNTTASNSDINYQASSGRQQGFAAPFRWIERPETGVGGVSNGLSIVGHPSGGQSLGLFCTGMSFGSDATKYIWVAPLHNFVDYPQQTINVKIDPYGGGSQPGENWAAVIFGTNLPGTYSTPGVSAYGTATSTGMAFVLTTDGAWTVYDSSAALASGTAPSHSGFYDVAISIDTASYDGRPTTITFKIDGVEVHSLVRPNGFFSNYVTLSGLGLGTTGYQTHFFDSFCVTRPEDVAEAPYAGPISGLKALPDGEAVALSGKVLYLSRESFGYIEELDRTSGIRIDGIISVAVDNSVDVAGTLATTTFGERCIRVQGMMSLGSATVPALGVNGRHSDDPHLNGMYVRVWGVVQPGSVTATSFTISDGSAPVTVLTDGPPGVSEGQFVVIDGAAGLRNGRVIYARTEETVPA